MPEIDLTSPLAAVPGVTHRDAAALAALGVTNVGKLVAYLPSRHEPEEPETPIAQLAADAVVATRGEVTATRVAGFGRSKRFEAVLHDGEQRLELVWFNQTYLRDRIGAGTRLRVQGKARRRGSTLQLANPRFDILVDPDDEPERAEGRLRPVYPASEQISSRRIERVIALVLDDALAQIDDHLSADHRKARELPTLADAHRHMHAPAEQTDADAARRRLAYDELLMLQLGVHLRRAHLRRTLRAPALDWNDRVDARIRERIPFQLTDAQDRVVNEIASDLSSATPANRLVQGDVGSGKTVVALYAMLLAVASEHQAALMAPTEMLAEQHFASISNLLQGAKVRVELLTGAAKDRERRSILARLEDGSIDILIGTHALLTESVRFRSLAAAVIDEQHRFGVLQRAGLRTNATVAVSGETGLEPVTPHVLVMTATPIPRTLAMTVFGDLDVSTIDALPPGRKPIETLVKPPDERTAVYDALRRRLDAGEQAYVVVPTIDGGSPNQDDPEPPGVRALVKELESGPLAGKRVAAVHGRLERTLREHVMHRFRSGLIDCLVATTVIEVGVDVPNATVMIVEAAERFGLAQLHQLRGRVGRGDKPSVCVLIGDPTTDNAVQRLRVMEETTSGFELAERDMQIRGPGELFGAKQSGLPPFNVADLAKDFELLGMARADAAAWIDRSPRLDKPEDALAKRRLLKRYGQALGIGDVG